MINELHPLSGVLSDMDIQTRVWHREYKQLPNATTKSPCYRIWVTEAGTIDSISELDPDTVRKLRKYGNNQASFPAFNIRPLYRIIDEDQKKTLEKIEKNPSVFQLSAVKSWLINDNWHKSLLGIDGAIREMSSRMYDAIAQHDDEAGLVVIKLIQAVSLMKDGLRAALESYILSSLESGENAQMLLRFLLHSGDAGKTATDDTGKSLSVILDLAEWDKYGYPVASESTTLWINDALNHADETEEFETAFHSYDAFGLPYVNGWTEPMPSVKLPGFDVTLRAMFHEQRCQQRYGEFNDGSYPISKESRVAAKQALEWIAEPEREGITWKRADKDEIVFAYPSKLTQTPIHCASLFGLPPGKEGESNRAQFEKCAQDFANSLDGIPPKEQPEYIRVFSIRKMDKARSKVVLTRNCSPQQLVTAAEDWVSGCANVPKLDFIKPSPLFPLDVARIVNTIWKLDGKQATSGKTAVKRMQNYQGIDLLLDIPAEITERYDNDSTAETTTKFFYNRNDDLVRNYLRILLSNTEGLINHIGNSMHSGVFITPYYAAIVAKTAAVLGLLMYKGGHRKEDYMQNTAYLLGQMLKASDELHTFYCKVERNGDVPPQLAGNSMFAFASETPHRALAQIGLRMQPYISWAKRYRTLTVPKNDVPNGLVGWSFSLLEDISSKLSVILVEETRFNEYDKAQLFLGYLAAFPKREKMEHE